jgi:hypothetical protein
MLSCGLSFPSAAIAAAAMFLSGVAVLLYWTACDLPQKLSFGESELSPTPECVTWKLGFGERHLLDTADLTQIAKPFRALTETESNASTQIRNSERVLTITAKRGPDQMKELNIVFDLQGATVAERPTRGCIIAGEYSDLSNKSLCIHYVSPVYL